MSDYTVCRCCDLRVGDMFLEPWSGALAKITDLCLAKKPNNITIKCTLVVAMTTVSVDLHERRPMRRKWRDGEQRD